MSMYVVGRLLVGERQGHGIESIVFNHPFRGLPLHGRSASLGLVLSGGLAETSTRTVQCRDAFELVGVGQVPKAASGSALPKIIL